MGGRGVLLVRGAVADVAVDDDQGRAAALLAEALEGPRDQLDVVGVADPVHVPAVAHEAGGDVVLVGELGVAVDRDVVVVVDPAEVVEPQVAGDRGGLARDALHQAAVAADRVDVEVEQLGAEVLAVPLAGDRHPDRGRDPLAERPGGGLDPRGEAVLGVPGGLRVELAEALDVGEADRRLALGLVVGVDRLDLGEVKQRVEQHRGVAGREHEAVAVGPDRVGGVEAQVALPERVGDRGQRHRRPRMPGVGLLDRVDRERPDRVDAELVDIDGAGCGRGSLHLLLPILPGPDEVLSTSPPHTVPGGLAELSPAELEKRVAARAAAALVADGMTVGLGTGSTVAHLLPALAERGLKGIRCVATSPATEEAARELGIPVEHFEALERLEIAIDGADQVTPDGWLIKGGGGAHLREKIVAGAAERFVVIADSSKPVEELQPAGAAGAVRLRPALDPGPARRGRAARRAAEPRRRPDRRLPRRIRATRPRWPPGWRPTPASPPTASSRRRWSAR